MMIPYSKLKPRARQIVSSMKYVEKLESREKPKLRIKRIALTNEKWNYQCSWCGSSHKAQEGAILETDAIFGIHKYRRFCLDVVGCDDRRSSCE